MLLFGLIDGKLISCSPNSAARRSVGSTAARRLFKEIIGTNSEKESFLINLYFLNLLACINTVFQDAKDFTLETEVINRNFVDHGMLTRPVTRRECIQLFLLLYNTYDTFSDE